MILLIMKRLGRDFFLQPTLKVATNMLGKYLVHRVGKNVLVSRIVETEAYIGPRDKASHGYAGKKTQRNRAEYMLGGHIYIYLVYGMYWQMNISTGPEGEPECVLLRALEPVEGLEEMAKHRGTTYTRNLTSGPGKLCIAMRFSGKNYGEDIVTSKNAWLEDRGDAIPRNMIVRGPRIGIDYAGPVWSKKQWRFWIKDNSFISKK